MSVPPLPADFISQLEVSIERLQHAYEIAQEIVCVPPFPQDLINTLVTIVTQCQLDYCTMHDVVSVVLRALFVTRRQEGQVDAWELLARNPTNFWFLSGETPVVTGNCSTLVNIATESP